jgi:16S rRNA processing protein RimM
MKTIGRITKTYGFEGAVVVRSESGITGEPQQGEPVFVVTDGIPVPFFTREAYCTAPDTLIISFDDYPTPESVAHLRGCEVLAHGGEEPADDLKALKGFTLTDTVTGLSGTVTGIIQNPGQLMAVALIGGQEVYIPLHLDLIVSVDKRHKAITMALPEGLISLND